MKTRLIALIIILAAFQPASGQQSWIMLQEYPSPSEGARGLYYAGKLLWNVDNESQTVFTLNPYNLEVIDIYTSPVDQPWGITCDNYRFWMTNFGSSTSQLVRLQEDTFVVDITYDFPGYYFYGLTYDSVGQHLWISAMNHGYTKFLLEFDGFAGQVVQWHSWPYIWNLGLQYWDRCLWVNSSNWNYPDYTYIFNLDSMSLEEMLTCPLSVPEGIATNGIVWWMSHFRNNSAYIWKLVPPGTDLHDIAWYSPYVPPGSGIFQELVFEPQARFINYGAFTEIDVPFVCKIKEIQSGNEIYYDSLTYSEIAPEEIVIVTYGTVFLQPDLDYKITFYSNLPTDCYRDNDTLRIDIHTEGVVHDLAILSVLEPENTEPLDLINPAILVQNQGDVFEPIAPVHLQIEHPGGALSQYDAQVIDLDPYEIDTIYFTPFDPPEAGEYIFTFDGMLPDDINPANDLVVVNCFVGLAHDVAPVEILSPESFELLEPIQPVVIVENLGDFSENAFYTSCSVSDSTGLLYWQQVICPPLDPGDQFTLDFPNFVPQYPAHYNFTFTTILGGDNRPENDTMSVTSAVGLVYDVSPLLVIEPPEILTPDPFQPAVVVSNLGNVPSDGFYTCCQVDSGSTQIYYQQSWVLSLEPGEADTAVFPTMVLSGPGSYRFLFITNWFLDNYPENDTLEFWAEFPPSVSTRAGRLVTDFRVEGGFPNPFNARTAFIIHLPGQASVELDLYNLEGRRVCSYSLGLLDAGVHQAAIDAGNLPSGIYIARIQAEKWSQSTKIALLK